jgi:hypothetical protein
MSWTARLIVRDTLPVGSLWAWMNGNDTSGVNLCVGGAMGPGRIGVTVRGSSGVVVGQPIPTTTLETDTVYELAFTYDGAVTKFYVDGIEVFSSTDATGNLNLNTTNDFRIGYDPDNPGQNTGLNLVVDNVRYWENYALTAPEVASVALADPAVSPVPNVVSGLVAVPGNEEVSLSWNVPVDNGAVISGYAVETIPPAVSDDFNRADSTNLGPNWIEDEGNWSISGNQLTVSDLYPPTECVTLWSSDIGSPDHYVEADVVWSDVNYTASLVVARCGPDPNLIRWQGYINFEGSCVLAYRDNAPSAVAAVNDFPSFTPVSGNTYRLRLECVGDRIRLYVDDVLQVEAISSLVGSTQGVGVWARQDQARTAQFDNFTAGAILTPDVVTQTSTIVTNLANNGQHGFRVAAISDGGQGPWSDVVNATPVGFETVMYAGDKRIVAAYLGTTPLRKIIGG